MTIIVEDGTGTLASESYASVADCDTYATNRNISTWLALATVAKEAYLRLATDYMMQVYRERWNGTRVTNVQALDWPRYLVPMKDAPGSYRMLPAYYSYTIVPTEVKTACCLLAIKAIAGELAPDLAPPVASEAVGAISVSYIPGARQTVRYQAVDHVLSPLLKDGGSGSLAPMYRG